MVSKIAVVVAAAFVSVGSLVLAVLLFETFADERRNDLKAATVEDIAALGTCIEAPSPDAISQTAALKDDWKCAGNVKEQDKLSNLLAASTHAIYHAAASSTDPSLIQVANVVLAAAIGVTNGAVTAAGAKAALEAVGEATMLATCDDVYPGVAAGPDPAAVRPVITCAETMPPEVDTNVWSSSLAVLYAHCVRQFAFGESGPADGSFGTPVYGEEAGWAYSPFPLLGNFSGQTSSTKAKIYLGTRFGACCWSYSLLMLGLGFCVMDGVMVVISDGTSDDRWETTWRDRGRAYVLMMSATATAKRDRRWQLLLIIVIVAAFFLAYFLWVPYGMGYRLGSPICETDEDADDRFRIVAGSRGGWKSDWGSTVVELLCLLWMVLCLILLPIARYAGDAAFDRKSARDANDPPRPGLRAFVDAQSLRTASNFFIASFGTVLLVLAFAITGSVFGYAWAKATMGLDVAWTAELTAGYVYSHGLDALLVMVACGMALAAIQGRWTITGYGTCTAICIPTLVWILFAFLPVALVVVAVGSEAFVDRKSNTKECEIFDGGFDRASCTVKWIFLIVGAILVVFVLVVMAASFLLKRLSANRSSATGSVPEQVGNPGAASTLASCAAELDTEPLLGGTITRGKSRKLAFHLPIRME